jgi:hypothetical protein
MPKIIIKAYDTVIHNEWYEDGASVLIGVIEASITFLAKRSWML